MECNLKTDGSRIRALRLDRRWERGQLAQIAGVNEEDLRILESAGKASFETIQAVARAFGLEIQELLHDPASVPPGVNPALPLKPGQNQVLLFLWPYFPIVKSALAASAFVLLGAFAIRLSPFIIERDPMAELVESFEIFQPAYPTGVASLEAELGTEIISDSEDPAANPRYAYRKTTAALESARISLMPGAGNFPVEPVAPDVYARRPDIPSLPENRMDYWATAASAITLHSADFTSLASPRDLGREVPLEMLASVDYGDPARPDGGNVFKLMARGTSTGFKTVGRSLVISGKSTASFFSKVGSSIKRAF